MRLGNRATVEFKASMKSKSTLALVLVLGMSAVGGSAQEAPNSAYPSSFVTGSETDALRGGLVQRTAGYETDRGRLFVRRDVDRKSGEAENGGLTVFQRIGRYFRSNAAPVAAIDRRAAPAKARAEKKTRRSTSRFPAEERLAYVFAPGLDELRSAAGDPRRAARKSDRLTKKADSRRARLEARKRETRERETAKKVKRGTARPLDDRGSVHVAARIEHRGFDEKTQSRLIARMGTDRGDAGRFGQLLSKVRVNKPVTSNRKYGLLVDRYARAYGVPVELAHAVIKVESNYRPNARGRAGEVGLMQIKPATARMMGYSGSVKALYDPENNIKYGMAYLAKAHKLGGGSTCGTILKYNAGHGARRMNPVSARYCAKVKRHLRGI